jgi:hypothetical protein
MKRLGNVCDLLILGGFISSFFTGLLYPHYIKLVLSSVDLKILSLGYFFASGFPFLTGMFLESRRLYRKLYALLPAVMLAEIAVTAAAVFLSTVDLAVYYLAAMVVFGLFSTTVTFLLQRLKEKRYARRRATFERRYSMADALGYLLGSLLVFWELFPINRVQTVLILGLLQTTFVYILTMLSYRKIEGRGKHLIKALLLRAE